MQVIHGMTGSPSRPCAATIGFFDGVHRGHRFLIDQVRAVAAGRGLAVAVVTFPVHPRKVMQAGSQPGLLTTPDEKTALLAGAGVDYCLVVDFTPEVERLSAREFMALLKERFRVEVLVTGYDHRFGHRRSEGFDDYVRYGRQLGMEVVPARAYILPGGSSVCSSTLRSLLSEGKVAEAARGLGYPYFLTGTVVRGHRVGHTLGFPTANLRVDNADKLVPADGVYAVRVQAGGQEYGGMLCIGRRPTLDNGPERSIEVHIFGFGRDIYGHTLRVSFVQYVRPEARFDSLDALKRQLADDASRISALLAGTHP